MSEQEEFLKEIEVDDTKNILDQPLETEPEKEAEPGEGSEMNAKNRRERRLLEKNQQLREEAIAYAARLQAIEESRQVRNDTSEAEYVERVKRIYGDATPEAKEATNLLIEALRGVEESATQRAYAKLAEERVEQKKELQEAEETLDSIADRWEDDYGIDMSDASVRKSIFSLLEKLSPKDEDGNIKEFADEEAVAEIYLSSLEKASNRAKALSSRSMTRGSGSPTTKVDQSAMERTLREYGIL
jgi:hypothetical protein